MNSREKKRDLDTDVMRIFAAFAVVLIHASTKNSDIGVFLDAVSRFSVSLFVLISGYYMLDSKISYSKVYKKCFRLLSKMIIWSLVYYAAGIVYGGQSRIGVQKLISYLLTEPSVFWYIWATITLYIFTPIFFVFCENAEKKDYLYALFITFFFGSVITILMRSGYVPILADIVEKMKVAHLLGFVFLYLLGGYFRRYPIESKKIKYLIYFGGFTGAVITYAGTRMFLGKGENENLLRSFFSPNAIFMSMAVFVFVKSLFEKIEIKRQWICNVIYEIAECTLGIYLIHILIWKSLRIIVAMYVSNTASGLSIILNAVVTFIVSMLIVMGMKRIPLLKKMVL